MEREKNGAVRSNALHGIKAGPVRSMIDALPVEKMAEIRRKSEQHNFKRSCFFSEKQLNLLDRVIELRHGTGTIPDLLILLPVTILIPGRNKILHKRFLSQTVLTGMKIYTRHNDNRSEFPESDCRLYLPGSCRTMESVPAMQECHDSEIKSKRLTYTPPGAIR